MARANQVDELLDGLSELDADHVAGELQEFDANDIVSALARRSLDGGGSSTVLTSYLSLLTAAGQTGIAMGTQPAILYTVNESSGSDLSLDVDGSTVLVNTPGAYVATLALSIAGAPNQIQLNLNPSALGTWDTYLPLDPTLGGATVVLTTGPVIFADPGSYTSTVYLDNSGSVGEFSITANTPLRIFRLA
jgi:hypothetical protein